MHYLLSILLLNWIILIGESSHLKATYRVMPRRHSFAAANGLSSKGRLRNSLLPSVITPPNVGRRNGRNSGDNLHTSGEFAVKLAESGQDNTEFTEEDIHVMTSEIDNGHAEKAVEHCFGTLHAKFIDSNPWAVIETGYTNNKGQFIHYLDFAKQMYKKNPTGTQWSSTLFALFSGLKKRREYFGSEFPVDLFDWVFYEVLEDKSNRNNAKLEILLGLFMKHQIPRALKYFCDMRNGGFRLCSPLKGKSVLRQVNHPKPIHENQFLAYPKIINGRDDLTHELWIRRATSLKHIYHKANLTRLNCHHHDCRASVMQGNFAVGPWNLGYLWKLALGRDDEHIALADQYYQWVSFDEKGSNHSIIVQTNNNNNNEKTVPDLVHTLLVCNEGEPMNWD